MDRPSTWPWVVYVWIAMLLVGWVKPAWRWFQRREAGNWPTRQGRIESVGVDPKKQFLVSTTPRSGVSEFTASLAYSYSVDGQPYSGHYEQEFGSKEEGLEFVRGLQGKSVMVSHSPRSAAKSTLTEDAIAQVLKMRPPLAEIEGFEAPVSDLPGWVTPLLWPFIVLSAIGLGLSLWVHLGAVAGKKVAPEPFFWMLHVGIFIVWFPAVFIANRRVGNTGRRDFWKVVLTGSPDWMRYVVYGFLGYAMVNFLIFMFQAPEGGKGDPPAVVWRGFSGHWMAFYSAALAILYSAAAPQARPTFQRPPNPAP